MKELLRNINTYFVAVPVILGLVVVYTFLVTMPAAEKKWSDEQEEYKDAMKKIAEIIKLNPERVKFSESGKEQEFNYATVINAFTKQHAIPSGQYSIKSNPPVKISGKQAKTADMDIKTIDIQKLAKFLSDLTTAWPELECSKLSIDKIKNAKDNWKVSVRFVYYY